MGVTKGVAFSQGCDSTPQMAYKKNKKTEIAEFGMYLTLWLQQHSLRQFIENGLGIL